MTQHSILILPDIHGRDFWKKAVENLEDFSKVVFLGDYLDPYEDERISWDEALKGFDDIINLKKSHPDKVSLLLGNHDLHYLHRFLKGTRYSRHYVGDIRKTIVTNLECFRIAEEYTVGGKRYLMSHAGVHPIWAMLHESILGPKEDLSADKLNGLMDNPDFIDILSDVSFVRGGRSIVGSMVWADIEEFARVKPIAPDIVQICGHTRLMRRTPLVFNDVWCLDCQKAFVLSEDGIAEYQ